MKKAIAYIRISDKDQSNFSLEGQTDMIHTYCNRNSWELIALFVDDGKSAKNFDRPDWKRLEAFIHKNHTAVDYLLVCKYDRFSRRTSEALQKLELIEERFSIRILSVLEPIHVHPDSPFFFQIRAQLLVGAQVEWLIIRDRTRFGNHFAAKKGRYINHAPVGYINKRDENNKPIIVVDEIRASIIRQMFAMFLQGASFTTILREARNKGFTLRGHDVVPRTLSNPVYAGMVKVPAYNEEPAQLTKGLHQAIIEPSTYWAVQEMLFPKKAVRTVMNETVPLRAVLKCFCGRTFTAGNSKGRSRYYWYYKCESHKKYNWSADKLHAQFDLILKELSLSSTYIEELKNRIVNGLKTELEQQHVLVKSKKQELTLLQQKLENVEERFFSKEIDSITYQKWSTRYLKEIAICQREIIQANTPITEVMREYEAHLPRLADLHDLYHKASLHQKQALVRIGFKSDLRYEGGIYRTAYLLPLFHHKAMVLKEKGLLILEQPNEKSAKKNACAPDRT